MTETEILDTLLGMSKDLANELCLHNGYTTRVTGSDGEHFIVTMDFRMDRINLILIDDIVTESSIG